MNEELTPLEALENIIVDLSPYLRKTNEKEIEIVKTALERLEKIEKTTHSVLREDISNKLKALEIIKENLVVGYDENENDKPCLIIGIKVNKDKLVVIYQTNEQDKIDLLKEVLS